MPKKINTLAAIESAQKDLQAARVRKVAAVANLKICRQAQSEAILAWQGFAKPDPDKVYREHLRRQADRAAAIKRGDIVEHRPAEVDPVWPIDLTRRGRKSNINQNFNKQCAGLRRP
jgi:hypothetical protein